MITFTCPGVPQPKGSTRAFVRGGRAVVTSDNLKVAPWQTTIGWAAQRAPHACLLTGPIALSVVFYFPSPLTLPKARAGYPMVRPDLDKLTRALLDALTGVLYRDDGQVCDLTARKRYSDHPRVEVTLTALEEERPCSS